LRAFGDASSHQFIVKTLVYRILRWGQPYVDEGAQAYEKRYREARVRRLTASAAELGCELILKPANA